MEAGFLITQKHHYKYERGEILIEPGVLNAIMDLLEETHGF